MTFFWQNPVVALLGPSDRVRLRDHVCIDFIEDPVPDLTGLCGEVVDIKAGSVVVRLESGDFARLYLDRNQVWYWEGEPVALIAAA